MINCLRCGTANTPGNKFCNHCGCPLPVDYKAIKEQQKKDYTTKEPLPSGKSRAIFLAASVLTAILLCGIGTISLFV